MCWGFIAEDIRTRNISPPTQFYTCCKWIEEATDNVLSSPTMWTFFCNFLWFFFLHSNLYPDHNQIVSFSTSMAAFRKQRKTGKILIKTQQRVLNKKKKHICTNFFILHSSLDYMHCFFSTNMCYAVNRKIPLATTGFINSSVNLQFDTYPTELFLIECHISFMSVNIRMQCASFFYCLASDDIVTTEKCIVNWNGYDGGVCSKKF